MERRGLLSVGRKGLMDDREERVNESWEGKG